MPELTKGNLLSTDRDICSNGIKLGPPSITRDELTASYLFRKKFIRTTLSLILHYNVAGTRDHRLFRQDMIAASNSRIISPANIMIPSEKTRARCYSFTGWTKFSHQ
jgi:hypothetical protein